MNTKKEDIITQINTVLTQFDIYKEDYVDPWAEHGPHTTIDEISHIFTSLLTTIQRFSPPTSSFYSNALKISEKFPDPDIRKLHQYVQALAGILLSLREAYQRDYLQTVQELVHAEIFDDFLEMAEYLLDSNYKDPAAVMIGSILEEHIRKMCSKCGIILKVTQHGTTILKKADLLNAELEKQGIYNKMQQKQITAWFGLRNDAAHGKYTEYTQDQVKNMLLGVRDFILRYPA